MGTKAMWHIAERLVDQPLHMAVSWLGAPLHLRQLVEQSIEPPKQPVSWQDIHRQDTAQLAFLTERCVRRPREITASVMEHSLAASELAWMRQNATLVYLLRTGQWAPVPATPPDSWAQSLATKSSGVTITAARKVLAEAIATAPHPAKPAFPAPLSAGEHIWAKQNGATVHGLYNGQLRGAPTNPSRAWVAAFQSAVGGTTAEIVAILSIIVDVIHQKPQATVTAE